MQRKKKIRKFIDKEKLFEEIMKEVAVIVKRHIEALDDNTIKECIQEGLYEFVNSNLEKKNEQFVEKVCKDYNLIYNEGDSVCCSKKQLNDLKIVRNIISKCMVVHPIKWVGTPENQYYFAYESWRTKRL